MSTTFEPSLSISAMRAPFASAAAPSMADTLPSINFGFDELRDRMAKFTVKFDNFIEQGRKRVLEERNQFRVNVAELEGMWCPAKSQALAPPDTRIENQRMKKKDIEILSSKATSHEHILSKEAMETEEMKSAIASLTTQRDLHMSRREALTSQIADTQKAIAARQEAQRAHAQYLDTQARFNVPELDFWTTNLCLSIEGAGQNDRLKFIFTHIDERDWDREAWFELDTGKREYEVSYCKPKLEKEMVDKIVEALNESRDLRVLLKGMRELFVNVMKA